MRLPLCILAVLTLSACGNVEIGGDVNVYSVAGEDCALIRGTTSDLSGAGGGGGEVNVVTRTGSAQGQGQGTLDRVFTSRMGCGEGLK